MANRIPSPGDSPPRRILVQAALPKVSITPATGRGMCEFPPNRSSLLRNLAVAGNLTRANAMECSMTTGGGTDNSGKLYSLQRQSSVSLSPESSRAATLPVGVLVKPSP
jgi:hypothetical protein